MKGPNSPIVKDVVLVGAGHSHVAVLRMFGMKPLASVRFNYDWDWTGAEQEYRRAIQLSPGYATARHWYSLLLIAQDLMQKPAR